MLKRQTSPFVAISLLLAATAFPVLAQTVQPEAPAGGFAVTDMQGHVQQYRSFAGQVTVVIFFSTRCPLSNAFNFRRNELFREFQKRARFLVIDANSNESLEEVRTYALDVGFDFPVYRDNEDEAAGRLAARSTTDTFVLDQQGIVRYRGFIEDAPNPARTTVQGLRLALEAVLAGRRVSLPETRPIGCALRRAGPHPH